MVQHVLRPLSYFITNVRILFKHSKQSAFYRRNRPAQMPPLKSPNTRVCFVTLQRVYCGLYVINMADNFRWAELRSGIFDDASSHVTVWWSSAARCHAYLYLRQRQRSADWKTAATALTVRAGVVDAFGRRDLYRAPKVKPVTDLPQKKMHGHILYYTMFV